MSTAALVEALVGAGVEHLTSALRRDLVTAGSVAVHGLCRFAESVDARVMDVTVGLIMADEVAASPLTATGKPWDTATA